MMHGAEGGVGVGRAGVRTTVVSRKEINSK